MRRSLRGFARRGIVTALVKLLAATLLPQTGGAETAAAHAGRDLLENDVVDFSRPPMPRGVPPAARRKEPRLAAPAAWKFSEAFPRTMGTGRLASGAMFWTDFLYDDNGAVSGPG